MIETILFYTIFSSVILIYGIGLHTSTVVCGSVKKLYVPALKAFSIVIFSSAMTWLFIKFVLVPLAITGVYPLVASLFFFSISILIEKLFRSKTNDKDTDFNFLFLVTVLVLNESAFIVDVLLISFSSLLSFVILLPLLYSLKNKIDIVGNTTINGNRKALLLISVSIIMMVLLFANVSVLNPGVLK